jgi:hypothetical protein
VEAGRCSGIVVARCTSGVVVSTPPVGAGVAGALACCAGDFVALVVRCAGVVRGAVSAGVESTGCAGDCVDDCVGACAAGFLAAVAALVARGAERVRGTVPDGAAEAAAEAAAGVVLVASVTFCVGTTGAVLSEAAAVDAGVVARRLTTGFTSCSEFSPGSAVEALTGLERVLVRLLVAAGFTCSAALVSGDSDVFLMKKTPFYRMMRHKR